MRLAALILLATLAACGDRDEETANLTGEFQRFASAMNAVSDRGDNVVISMSSRGGDEACHAAADLDAGIGDAGHQIAIQLPAEWIQGTGFSNCGIWCEYVIQGSCPEMSEQARRDQCATYTAWNSATEVLGRTVAVGGTVRVSTGSNYWDLDVNLQFPSGAKFIKSFSVTQTASEPWCSE